MSKAPLILGGAGACLGAAALAIILLRPFETTSSRHQAAAPVAEQSQAPTQVAQQTPPSQPAPTPTGTTIPPDATPAEAFAILAKSGGIVQDAKTAPELYHNARSFEARGDGASARRDYLALARLGGDAIDPYLRLAALLRAQDGRAGARDIYGQIADQAPGRAAALVHALQFDGDERRRRLEVFAAAQPDYAPAQYLLADEYSEDRSRSQTIADKRLEANALGHFLDADTDGKLTPFFLDQSVLADWVDRARKRQTALSSYLDTATLTPTANFMRSNSGWMVALSLPEPATSLSWRIGEVGEFASTGLLTATDPRTGRSMPNPSFELPGAAAAMTIDVRYDDASGRTVGPFPIRFDPRIELVRGQRDILEKFSNSWISFGSGAPRNDLLYYTQLMSYRCAIAKAELGFGDGPLSTQLTMPACNQRDPNSIPSDAKPYLTVPANVKFVSVRLTYADGGQSPVKTFSRQ